MFVSCVPVLRTLCPFLRRGGEREAEIPFALLLFSVLHVWYTRDNVAINIFYQRTCVAPVFATCSHIRSSGGTTPIGGAIKLSIEGIGGTKTHGEIRSLRREKNRKINR